MPMLKLLTQQFDDLAYYVKKWGLGGWFIKARTTTSSNGHTFTPSSISII